MNTNQLPLKSLRALTCGLSLAAAGSATAESSVSFVGELDSYLGYTQPAGSKSLQEVTGLESNGLTTSYAGVHGSHDLGNGITVVGALEGFLRPDSGALGRFDDDLLFARAANIGFKGDFGQISFGRNASPYFLSTILMNPYGDSFSFSPMVLMSFGGGGIYGDSGWSNSVVYTMPTMSGFTNTLAYAFGEKAGDASTNKMAANTFYKSGDFGFTAAVHKISGMQSGAMSLGADDTQTAVLLGGSYSFGANAIYLQYQSISDDLTTGDIDRDAWVLSASLAAGKGAFYLSAGTSTSSMGGKDYDRTIFTIMYDLPLSKKCELYFGFTNDSPDGAAQDGQTLGAGARFRF